MIISISNSEVRESIKRSVDDRPLQSYNFLKNIMKYARFHSALQFIFNQNVIFLAGNAAITHLNSSIQCAARLLVEKANLPIINSLKTLEYRVVQKPVKFIVNAQTKRPIEAIYIFILCLVSQLFVKCTSKVMSYSKMSDSLFGCDFMRCFLLVNVLSMYGRSHFDLHVDKTQSYQCCNGSRPPAQSAQPVTQANCFSTTTPIRSNECKVEQPYGYKHSHASRCKAGNKATVFTRNHFDTSPDYCPLNSTAGSNLERAAA